MPPLPNAVSDVVAAWPKAAQSRFHEIRGIVFDATKDIARLTLVETLKWGEPSWLPDRARIGSTLRVAWSDKSPDQIGLFVNCNTAIGDTMRQLYPADFTYDGTRALRLPLQGALPVQAIAHCAVLTLTWHSRTA